MEEAEKKWLKRIRAWGARLGLCVEILRTRERVRLAALDAMARPGLEEIIAKAKADGKQPQDIALDINAVLNAKLDAAEKRSALARDAAGAGG